MILTCSKGADKGSVIVQKPMDHHSSGVFPDENTVNNYE